MHVHAKVARLLGSEVTSLAESEIGQDSDGLLLLLDHRLDQILDGDHSVKFTIFAHQQQMAHVGIQHLLHARVDGVAWLGSDELAGRRRDLLYRGVLGSAAEQGDLGDVVTFGDDASEVSCWQNTDCGAFGHVIFEIGCWTLRVERGAIQSKNVNRIEHLGSLLFVCCWLFVVWIE